MEASDMIGAPSHVEECATRECFPPAALADAATRKAPAICPPGSPPPFGPMDPMSDEKIVETLGSLEDCHILGVDATHGKGPAEQPVPSRDTNLQTLMEPTPVEILGLYADAKDSVQLEMLLSKQFEVDMVLRKKIVSSTCLHQTVTEAHRLLGYLDNLRAFSSTPSSPVSNPGTLFQLLTNQEKLKESEEKEILAHLASDAASLCGLIKLKISDAGDLDTAKLVLKDCLSFFAMLWVWAESNNLSPMDALEAVRAA